MTPPSDITPDTKVAALLRDYPHIEERRFPLHRVRWRFGSGATEAVIVAGTSLSVASFVARDYPGPESVSLPSSGSLTDS